MMHGFWGGPWGIGWMGGIFMLIFWVFLIAGLILLVRRMSSGGPCCADHGITPLDVLKQRYARGEIDKKEFEEKKKDLGQ